MKLTTKQTMKPTPKKHTLAFIKTILSTLATIAIVSGITYALTYPSAPPTGETAGGKFMTYFNNMKAADCPAGQAMIGFNTDFTKKCTTVVP